MALMKRFYRWCGLRQKSTGQDGASPTLSIIGGYWYLNDVNTGVKAEGSDGNAPAIVSIVDVGGTILFCERWHHSNG
ncbi:hypothetical protein MASR1M31_07770 [Porphyromonadaceae bacterium]